MKRVLIDYFAKDKIKTWAARLVFFSLIGIIVYYLFLNFKPFTYYGWEVSEWLINYEGGFVRRGLAGELLLLLYKTYSFSPPVFIMYTIVISSIVFLLVVFRLFYKEGWSVMILPVGCCLKYIIFTGFARRDLVMLLMIYVLFYIFKQMIAKYSTWSVLIFEIFSIILLLFHEASFFFTFPLLVLLLNTSLRHKNISMVYIIIISITLFLPVLCVLIMICICRGNENVATEIWKSWENTIITYPDGFSTANSVIDAVTPSYLSTHSVSLINIGEGVNALTWNTIETFYTHFFGNYIGMHYPYVRAIKKILYIAGTYYLVTRINTVNPRFSYPLKSVDTIKMSNILLFQFIFMLPLFTILSVDWGRTLPYWVFSSLFAYHFFDRIDIPIINRISIKFQQKLENTFCNNPYVYLVVLISIPYISVSGWV